MRSSLNLLKTDYENRFQCSGFMNRKCFFDFQKKILYIYKNYRNLIILKYKNYNNFFIKNWKFQEQKRVSIQNF